MCRHCLGTGDSTGNKADKVLDLMEIVLRWRLADNKKTDEEISGVGECMKNQNRTYDYVIESK